MLIELRTDLSVNIKRKCIAHLCRFIPTELPREEFHFPTSCSHGYISASAIDSEGAVDLKVGKNFDEVNHIAQSHFNAFYVFIWLKIHLLNCSMGWNIWPESWWPLCSESTPNTSDCFAVFDTQCGDWSTLVLNPLSVQSVDSVHIGIVRMCIVLGCWEP